MKNKERDIRNCTPFIKKIHRTELLQSLIEQVEVDSFPPRLHLEEDALAFEGPREARGLRMVTTLKP